MYHFSVDSLPPNYRGQVDVHVMNVAGAVIRETLPLFLYLFVCFSPVPVTHLNEYNLTLSVPLKKNPWIIYAMKAQMNIKLFPNKLENIMI